jgi:hypothetical protein
MAMLEAARCKEILLDNHFDDQSDHRQALSNERTLAGVAGLVCLNAMVFFTREKRCHPFTGKRLHSSRNRPAPGI